VVHDPSEACTQDDATDHFGRKAHTPREPRRIARRTPRRRLARAGYATAIEPFAKMFQPRGETSLVCALAVPASRAVAHSRHLQKSRQFKAFSHPRKPRGTYAGGYSVSRI